MGPDKRAADYDLGDEKINGEFRITGYSKQDLLYREDKDKNKSEQVYVQARTGLSKFFGSLQGLRQM